MRLSGTDNTANEYFNFGGIFNQNYGGISTQSTSGFIMKTGSATTIFAFDLFSPKLAVNTQLLIQALDVNAGDSNSHGSRHNVATAFDSLSLIASTGTITGTIFLYGYNK